MHVIREAFDIILSEKSFVESAISVRIEKLSESEQIWQNAAFLIHLVQK